MCVVHGRACLPIPHSTYHRRPTVPQSHRSQTAIIWPPSLPPRLLYPCKLDVRQAHTCTCACTTSPPFPQNRACEPLPLPHRCGDHPHTPSHRTSCHTVVQRYSVRPARYIASIPKHRDDAWISVDRIRPRPNHRAASRPGTKPMIASPAPLSPVRPGQKCQVR